MEELLQQQELQQLEVDGLYYYGVCILHGMGTAHIRLSLPC
jgi:hypothetical protein